MFILKEPQEGTARQPGRARPQAVPRGAGAGTLYTAGHFHQEGNDGNEASPQPRKTTQRIYTYLLNSKWKRC